MERARRRTVAPHRTTPGEDHRPGPADPMPTPEPPERSGPGEAPGSGVARTSAAGIAIVGSGRSVEALGLMRTVLDRLLAELRSPTAIVLIAVVFVLLLWLAVRIAHRPRFSPEAPAYSPRGRNDPPGVLPPVRARDAAAPGTRRPVPASSPTR